MSALTEEQVRHIAKLARLHVSDEEVQRLAKELSSILDYIEMLQEVDTSNVEPTAQVTGMTNAFRDDQVLDQAVDPDALLATSPLPLVDHQIQTPSAHGE